MDWLIIASLLVFCVTSIGLAYRAGYKNGANWIINEWRDWLENFEEENENEQRKINRPGQPKR